MDITGYFVDWAELLRRYELGVLDYDHMESALEGNESWMQGLDFDTDGDSLCLEIAEAYEQLRKALSPDAKDVADKFFSRLITYRGYRQDLGDKGRVFGMSFNPDSTAEFASLGERLDFKALRQAFKERCSADIIRDLGEGDADVAFDDNFQPFVQMWIDAFKDAKRQRKGIVVGYAGGEEQELSESKEEGNSEESYDDEETYEKSEPSRRGAGPFVHVRLAGGIEVRGARNLPDGEISVLVDRLTKLCEDWMTVEWEDFDDETVIKINAQYFDTAPYVATIDKILKRSWFQRLLHRLINSIQATERSSRLQRDSQENDAEFVFSLLEKTLRSSPVCKGARVIMRRGTTKDSEREILL